MWVGGHGPGGNLGPEGYNQGGDITIRGAIVREGTTVREDTLWVINRAGAGVGVGLGIMISEGMVWEGMRNRLAASYHGTKGHHSAKRLEKGVEVEPGLVDIIVAQVLGLPSKKRKTLQRFHPFCVSLAPSHDRSGD